MRIQSPQTGYRRFGSKLSRTQILISWSQTAIAAASPPKKASALRRRLPSETAAGDCFSGAFVPFSSSGSPPFVS